MKASEVTIIEGSYSLLKYSIIVDKPVILLRGDSATGKSLLYRLFAEELCKKYDTIAINNPSLLTKIDFTKTDSFVVIDRLDVWGTDELVDIIRKALYVTPNKFIIISRFWGFQVSMNCVQDMSYADGTLHFVPVNV